MFSCSDIGNASFSGKSHTTICYVCRYVNGLFALAHDQSSEVRKVVCTGLVQMLHLQPNRLAPHMHDIIEYMLQSTQVRQGIFCNHLHGHSHGHG